MIGEAAQRAAPVGLTIDCRVCDAELDFASGSFDRSSASADCNYRIQRKLTEMVRMIRPGGRIALPSMIGRVRLAQPMIRRSGGRFQIIFAIRFVMAGSNEN